MTKEYTMFDEKPKMVCPECGGTLKDADDSFDWNERGYAWFADCASCKVEFMALGHMFIDSGKWVRC